MSDRVTAGEMRARLLAGLKRPVPASEDWVVVLGALGNRHLLRLIGSKRPGSIGELADLARRAQPNISRSLSALAAAGLVEIKADGRKSVPSLTTLGQAKAEELHLLEPDYDPSENESTEDRLFSVEFGQPSKPALPAGTDGVDGRIGYSVNRRKPEAETAFWSGDLVVPSARLMANWWRMLYRRDAPYKLLDLECSGERLGMFVRSSGYHVDLFLRRDGGDLSNDAAGTNLTVAHLEEALIEQWLKPLCANQRASGSLDHQLQSHLARLLDSMSEVAERTFCRTAGALNLSPYDLDEAGAAAVRDLSALIEDEDARLDFASAVLSEELGNGRLWIERELDTHRKSNVLGRLNEIRRSGVAPADRLARPWRRGRDLARATRRWLGLEADRSLGGLEGIATQFDAGGFELSRDPPGGIRGFQSLIGDNPVIVVEDEGPVSSAFVLARAIGDYLAFGSSNACVADLYTDRQAVGRAFAAEFLAPGAGVTAMIDEGQPHFRVKHHYGVSFEVVRRQYENFANLR